MKNPRVITLIKLRPRSRNHYTLGRSYKSGSLEFFVFTDYYLKTLQKGKVNVSIWRWKGYKRIII